MYNQSNFFIILVTFTRNFVKFIGLFTCVCRRRREGEGERARDERRERTEGRREKGGAGERDIIYV